jgi:hypothetical protein
MKNLLKRNMNETDDLVNEFADEYTEAERKRILLIGLVAGGAIIVVSKTWFFPWLHWFSEAAHCHTVFGYSGVSVLFYGLFVGLPLFSTTPFICYAWDGYRILRDRQAPPKHAKVFKRTKIVRGQPAIVRGLLLMSIVPVFFIPFVSWGFYEAGEMTKTSKVSKSDYAKCKNLPMSFDTPAITPTPH